MKKIISICLMAVLLCSVTLIFAEENGSETVNDRQKEAISLLNDIGIFSRVSEADAAKQVTRAQFAKTVVKVMGGEVSGSPRRIYTDVLPEHEAAASVEFLYERGVMVGYDDASFQPDAPVSVEEAAKVMVSVLGYSRMAEHKQGFPNGYYIIALTNQLLKGVSDGKSDKITTADLAVIIQNTLENTNYLVLSGYLNGDAVEEKGDGKPYMGYALNIYKYTGVLEAYGETGYDVTKKYQENICKVGSELFDKGDMDVSQYFGMKVNAYYRWDTSGNHQILHMAAANGNEVLEVNADDILPETTKQALKYEDGDRTETVSIANDAIFIYNGKRLTVVGDGDLIPDNGFVKLISNSGSEYNVVIIKNYETYIVEKAVASDEILLLKYNQGLLDLGGSNIKATYIMDGEPAEFSNITNGSVISVARSKNFTGNILAEVRISNNQVTGKAKFLENSGDRRNVTLEDDSQYFFTKEYIRRLEEREKPGQAEAMKDTYPPSLENEGTYYIDCFNKLAAYATLASGKNYAYVVKCEYKENTDRCYIRLFTKDAKMETFEFEEKTSVNGVKRNKEEIPAILKATGESGTVNQVVTFRSNDEGMITKLQTAADKTNANYYVSSEDEFVLNADIASSVRFYKNMAYNRPFTYVDNQTVQFLIPTDKEDLEAYRVLTKISSTDVGLPGPIRIYDAGPGGAIGVITTGTAVKGKYGTPGIIDKIVSTVDEDDEVCIGLQFVGGTTVLLSKSMVWEKAGGSWTKQTEGYDDFTTLEDVNRLRRGDIVGYTLNNNKVDKLKLLVKADNIGNVRMDGETLQESGNMVADILTVSNNGRTATVYYCNNESTYIYQTMLVNGPVYRYESSEDKVYNSSTADLRVGDRVLINSFWWSPRLVVIFR